MNTLPRHLLACLLVLYFSPLVPYTQAGETSSQNMTFKTALSSPTVNPQVAAVTEQTPQQLVLSLRNAVAMAVYRNIDLRIDALNFKMSEIEAAKSWGIYNPIFNASGSGGVTAFPGDPIISAKNKNASIGLTQTIPTGASISATTQANYYSVDIPGTASMNWQSTAGLTVTQPLLKNAGRETVELNITLAASTQQDSLDRFRATTIETVSNVITAYNHLYVLRQAQETRVAALNSAQILLDEIRKKATPGAVQGMEVVNAEFAIAQRRKDLVEAYRSVKDQEVNLRYLIGLDLPTPIIPSDPPSRDDPQETDEQVAKAALENRNDLKQLKLSLNTAQLQERVARRQSWPELSINASGGVNGSGGSFGDSYQQIGNHPGTFWNVGMVFSVPLGNTTASNEYLKSKIKTEQVQDQIRALSWKIRNDVGSDMRALISARLQIQLSDRSNQLAEHRLEEYRKNNKLGSATIQDVLNAENDWNTAHNAQLEAVETFSNAVIKLWKDAGLLLDRHGIHIDTSHPDDLTANKEQNPTLLVDPPSPVSPTPSPSTGQEQAQKQTTAPAPLVSASSDVATQKPAPAGMDKIAPAVHAPAPAAPHKFTLTIGEYNETSAMSDPIRRIKLAGLAPLVKQGPMKSEKMIRLYVAEYSNQKSALHEIGRLRKFKADGFIIAGKEKKFTVYAGSLRSQKQAEIEQERLVALGVKTVLKDASVNLKTFLLTAGSFSTLDAAVMNSIKLEKQGLKATIKENAD